MRVNFTTYIAAAVLILSAISCDKISRPSTSSGAEETGSGTASLDGNTSPELVEGAEGFIQIGVNVASTKSLLTSADLTGQTRIKVYDILSDDTHTKHINGDTGTYVDADSPWNLANAPTTGSSSGYSWRPNEEICGHNFFTWLEKDKAGLTPASIFGSNLSLTTASPDNGIYTINVPTTTITLGSSQFDFCLSDITTRSVANSNYSVVNLSLKHFFSAFGLKAHNYDSDAITITSVKLYGIKNTKSAVITYDTTVESAEAGIAFSGQASSWNTEGTGLELLASAITLPSDGEVNNIITCSAGGSKSTSAEDALYLMWPQTAAEMASTYDSENNLIEDFSKAILAITYSAGSSDAVTRYVSLCPQGKTQGWDAGTCHQIELSFTSKFVELTVSVLPWDYIAKEVNNSKQIACNSEGELKFVEGTYATDGSASSHTIYFKTSATPIRGYFSFATPVNGSWMISKNGDFDAFEIDNEALGKWGDGVDTAYGTIDGESTAYFTIYPKDQDPKRDYTIQLSFAVRTNTGDVYDANDVIQGRDKTQYTTITLQSMN